MPAKRHPEAFFFIHKPGILLLSNPLICPQTDWPGESGKAQKILASDSFLTLKKTHFFIIFRIFFLKMLDKPIFISYNI